MSAPDMLNTLKDVRAWVRHWIADKECNLPPTDASLQAALGTIDAAVAQAEGTSPANSPIPAE